MVKEFITSAIKKVTLELIYQEVGQEAQRVFDENYERSAKLSHWSGVQPSAVVPKGSMGSGTDSLCPGIGTGRRNRRNMMNKTCPHENGERSRPVK